MTTATTPGHALTISPDGTIRFVYSDALRPLLDAGNSRIDRASRVEPLGTRWTADLAPVGGPVLGPFDRRADALAAEVSWLLVHLPGLPLPAARHLSPSPLSLNERTDTP